MFTFISKYKNILVDFYNIENLLMNELEINEESNNIILNSSLNMFCINSSGENGNSNNNDDTDIGVLIHLLPINNVNKTNQNLNMPLIKGISTRQILKKGQFIYYRINENEIDSKLINIHFQNVTGNTKVYSMICHNFPNCDFSLENIDLKSEQSMINSNIYFNIKIENETKDIYHKSEFPVVVVFCNNENEDFCHFYIEMSNDKDTIFLNKDRKIYSFIKSDQEEYNYKFSLAKNNINANKKLFIQMTSLIGSCNFLVNNINSFEDYYYVGGNTIFFIYNFDKNINEFNIKVKGEKNSYYNIFYYIIDESEETKRKIYLPSGEMHYSILTKPNLKYSYYFQDEKKGIMKDYYFVTIIPINCNLHASKEGQENDVNINNLIIDSNERIKIYYENNNTKNDICEFIITAMEIFISKNLKHFRETILTDGIFQNLQISQKLRFNSAYFYYMISRDEIRNNTIYININKITEANLVLEYNINNNIINKNITNYNQIIEMNIKDINESSNSLETLYNFMIIKLAIHLGKKSQEVDINFKIKINGKYLPSYLNSDEIEYGYISEGNYIYYYFDYYQNEKFQIYFNCEGNANFKVVSNVNKNQKYKKLPNYEYYNNKYNLPLEKDFEGEKKYISKIVDKCDYNICQAYIIIFISNENNKKTFFNLYRLSEKNSLKIPFNQEIYGVLKENAANRFYSQMNYNEPIKIVLNCKKCKMCYYLNDQGNQKGKDTACKNPFEPWKDKYILINKNINKINYVIFSDTQKDDELVYFSLYVYKNTLPKFINQNKPEFCQTPCKLILPLYQFYYYNQKNIILYVPDDEQTIIYEKIVRIGDGGGLVVNNLDKFEIRDDNDNSSQLSLISNRLMININEIQEKYNDNVYMEIQIDSKIFFNEAKNITFITSQFYDSLNEEIIPYYQNIYNISDDMSDYIVEDVLNNLQENNLYKIDIFLIEGSGLFMLKNNNENYKYLLSHDTQERISLVLKTHNLSFKPEKNSREENLIFYLRVNEKENATTSDNTNDELIFSKTNYLNYFKENNDSNIFPIKLKLKLKQKNNNDLHINLYFSKLIKQNKTNDSLINVTNEKFDIRIYKETNGKNNEKNEIKGQVSLDITPFDIQEDIELPRNTYLEMKINKYSQNLKLLKPIKEYNNLYIELSSVNNIELLFKDNNNEYHKKETLYGKIYYSIINNQTEYKITIINSKTSDIGTILLKYITKKNNITQFDLINNNITWEKIDKENYNFEFKHYNIMNENKNYSNYKLSYLIRIYNYFSFEKGEEPKNILIEKEPIMSFRKELNEEEMKKDTIKYHINFGKLLKSKYYISILGEIINDNNVEYFTYNYIQFIAKTFSKEHTFDYTWIIVLIILFLALIFATYFLIKVFIKIRNENDKGKIGLLK